MTKLDTYLNLCTQVYDLSKPKAPKDAYAFYRSYAIKAKGPILEPMCGTGRFLLPLLEEGLDIQGFDASKHMLAALRTKASAKNLNPKVWEGFVEALKKPEKYNLIFIPSGSFGLMIDSKTVQSAIKIFYDHLSADGILLFDAETFAAVPQLGIWHGSIWHKPDGKMIILSNLHTFKNEVYTTLCKYELVHNNHILQTEIESLKVRVYDPHALTEILRNCGFKSVRMIKAFNSEAAPNNNDETIVYECRKYTHSDA